MINIYSIKEIIDASNNILNRTEPKNKVPYSEKSNPKKNTFLKKDQPLILTEVAIDEDSRQSYLNKLDLKVLGLTLTPLGYDDIAIKFM